MSSHTRHGLWEQPEVPHREWECVEVFDRGEDNLSLCEMCQFAMVRYVHVMEHAEYDERVHAGCICAEWMEGDYVNPKKREREVRNRTKRRESFVNRTWRVSRKGNAYLKFEGELITIFSQRGKWNFSVSAGQDVEFGPGGFGTPQDVKAYIFDLVDPKIALKPTV